MKTDLLALSGLNIFLSAPVKSIPEDIVEFTNDQKEKTLIIIGHGGKSLWENLVKTNPLPLNPSEHPIDNYSLSNIKNFAQTQLNDSDIEILFPNEKFLLPLQKLGRFFNLAKESPIGIDLSEEYGLWFAYRGVFLTTQPLPIIKKSPFCSPCDSCHERPCLTQGRLACPYKTEHQYTSIQLEYHALQLALLH